MADCARFGIAIDQRLAGALDESSARALDQHLAACGECRAYEETAIMLAGELQSVAKRGRGAVDWEGIERRIRRGRRARVKNLAFGVGVAVGSGALATWAFAEPGERSAVALAIAAILTVAVGVRAYFVAREVRVLSNLARTSELLTQHRAMLERQLQRVRRFRWLGLAVVLSSLVGAVTAGQTRAVVVNLAFATLIGGMWTRTLLVGYPRLRRELAELDRGKPPPKTV